MTEQTIQIISSLKLLLVVGFATLYAYGGMNGKWKRRIVGSVGYTIGIIGFSIWLQTFSWWLLSCALLYYGALSKGYGASTLGEKIRKRSIYGLLVGLASLPIAIVNGAWALFGFHIFLCILVSTTLGVWNITSSARAEESTIGATIALLPLMMF